MLVQRRHKDSISDMIVMCCHGSALSQCEPVPCSCVCFDLCRHLMIYDGSRLRAGTCIKYLLFIALHLLLSNFLYFLNNRFYILLNIFFINDFSIKGYIKRNALKFA